MKKVITGLALLVLNACAGQLSIEDEYTRAYRTPKIHQARYADKIDINKNGVPDFIIYGHDVNQNGIMDVLLTYRVTGIEYAKNGDVIINAAENPIRYRWVYEKGKRAGQTYMIQYDDNADGKIDAVSGSDVTRMNKLIDDINH